MKKIFRTMLLAFAPVMIFGASIGVAVTQPVFAAEEEPTSAVSAESKKAACAGIEATGGKCASNTDAANSGFSSIIKTIVNVLSVVVGAVSVIMIIIGGLRYILSNGDSNGVQGAKNTILYALVGLVIVLFAQTIVAFVLGNVSP